MLKLKNGLDRINKSEINLNYYKNNNMNNNKNKNMNKNNNINNINNNKNNKNNNRRCKKQINNLLYCINNNYNNYNKYYNYSLCNSESTNSINTANIYLSKPAELIIRKENILINREINSLDDLIKLIVDYPVIPNVSYNINLDKIRKIKEPLIELNNMIGMYDLKVNILDQLLFYIQEFHLKNGVDYMHTVLYGSPGTGKTEVAKIIGKIFSKLGILKNETFKKVVRSDLIAGYLGQTAIKTAKVIKESLGGVLFIDEAYALGNADNRDSFAKECIDTLCEALSDNKDNIMVIIAGYEEELNSCFFSYNQGLKSRFPWVFKTDKYTAEDLKNIFMKKVHDINWTFDDELKTSFFEANMEKFPYYGRDMEILLLKTKIAHGRRVFCKSAEEKTRLKLVDLEKGFELFKKYNIKNENEKEKEERRSFMMYN